MRRLWQIAMVVALVCASAEARNIELLPHLKNNPVSKVFKQGKNSRLFSKVKKSFTKDKIQQKYKILKKGVKARSRFKRTLLKSILNGRKR